MTVVILFEILAKSEIFIWKSTCVDLHVKLTNLCKGKGGSSDDVGTCLHDLFTAFSRRRTFVTALRNACERDEETREEAARARDWDEWKEVKGG